MSGLFVLVTVLVVASSIGVTLRRRQGKFKTSSPVAPREVALSPQGVLAPDGALARNSALAPDGALARTSALASSGALPPSGALTPEDLGVPLGERATLVQFSTEFCANCPPTKRLLGQVAAESPGVEFVEVDAAARLDLARRLNVYATPTILVLGPDGRIASRASGQPRKSDVLAAVGSVLEPVGAVLEPDAPQSDSVELGGR